MPHPNLFRYKGMGIDGARETEGHVGLVGIEFNFLELRVLEVGIVVGIGRVHLALHAQTLHVDFAVDELLLHGEAVGLGQQVAIFVDERATAEHQVLGGLAIPAARIDIARKETGTLPRKERLEVGVFADELVARTEVEDDVGTVQGQVAARRNGGPEVFADFDAEGAVGAAIRRI